MSANRTSTLYGMLLLDMRLYCGQRAVDGATHDQLKTELFGMFFDMLDRQGPEGPISPTENPWPSPISEGALYGVAGRFVRLVEPHTEADRVALLLQFLASFGSAAGRNAYVLVESDRHYPNLYVLLFGATAR